MKALKLEIRCVAETKIMMELKVSENTTLTEVKEKFSHYFPFLKLEFYQYQHQTHDRHMKKEAYKGFHPNNASEFFREGTIFFSANTTIAELEQEFQIELGLAAKIFRKSGVSWVDTSQTSHLTLSRQNNMGSAVLRMQFNRHTLFL